MSDNESFLARTTAKWQKICALAPELLHHSLRDGIGPQTLKLIPWSGRRHFVEITKRNDTLHAGINILDQSFFHVYLDRLPVVLHLMAQTAASVNHVWCDLGDDCSDEKPGCLGFCSEKTDPILIPDCGFFNTNAYADMRAELRTQRRWQERQNEILWRGSTTGGTGRIPDASTSLDAADILPRIRMCAILKGHSGVDVKILRCVQDVGPLFENRLREEGVFDPHRVDERSWLDRKYAIDIDGNSNAWSNLFIRLLFGCCVIKVSSPKGYRQWYYDELEPYMHYVPVRADMSDFADQIEWCRQNEDHCSQIAAAGQKLALSMTLRTELRAAIGRINERHG